MQAEATVPGRTVAPKTPEEFRADHARLGAIWSGFIERVREVPGVSSAAVATMNPLSGWFRGVRIAIHGHVHGPEQDRGVHLNQVTDGYFETTGIRLLTGRTFTSRDRSGSLRVAILNETAARAYFSSESPLGRTLNFPGQRVQDEFEIVGVVADTRYKDLRTPDERMVYIPLEQAIDPITTVAVAVRGPGDVTRLAPSIRAIAVRDPAWRARHRLHDDGAAGGDVARARADARAARHVLCRARADPGVHRPLRRDGVPRRPSHAGDRHPHRRRRQTTELSCG